jgi:tRNA(Ile)-lysidine synthase
VLLHLCALLPVLKDKITAVYINHGLQAVADDWQLHCEKTAKALQVQFLAIPVNATAEFGQSPEEAARNARYQAFRSLIGVNDLLLFAQHREDQLETVLLQLFRGSGLQGLSGMPSKAVFGYGFLLRPLLHESKQALVDYANSQQLQWVDDPSNFNNDYDRNFLRNTVIPQLKQRWPAMDKTVARSASHCADAQQLISAITEQQFFMVFDEASNALSISRMQALPVLEQRLVIRRWFRHLQLKMPAQAFIERIFTQVIAAQTDSNPQLLGQGYCLRRYRDKLYCLQQRQYRIPQVLPWPDQHTSLQLPDGRYLAYLPCVSGIPLSKWQQADVALRFRSGGEKIVLPGRLGRHSLKNLYQEAGIPPWQRPLIPLLYLNDELAAVGDLWISAAFYQENGRHCLRLQITT